MVCPALLVGLALAASGPDADAERADYIRSHYAKFEYRIPMRDGVRLFTSVYVPRHVEAAPFLMQRTPYSVAPYGADAYRTSLGPTLDWEKNGYIFVFQDVRGRFMSGGRYVNMRPHLSRSSAPTEGSKVVDEATDTYDTLAWLLEHVQGHNGRAGMTGISYPGFYTSAGAIDGHPALKAISPQAPIADWFWDDMHHHGAFVLPLAFNFFARFGVARDALTTEWTERFDHGTPDGYQFFLDLGPLSNANDRFLEGKIAFWSELSAHPNYDAFWQSRNILPHLKGVRAATLVVGGWFDTEDLYGPLETFAAISKHNPETPTHLVMGPWFHGAWRKTDGRELGEADFGFATAKPFREDVELPFFEHHLRDGPDPKLPKAMVFETGSNRWRSFPQWPPAEAEAHALFLGPTQTASLASPHTAGAAPFVSDPNKPVPYTMEVTSGWARKYMTEDQRFAARRPDVLVFRSPPLEDAVTVSGRVHADLWVSSDHQDADWVVKLVDEHPGRAYRTSKGSLPSGGVQRLVRAEVMRGRFRNDPSHPEPFVPGQPTRVRIPLLDVFHTFERGHRIVIHVQSSWFPFIDRNPQRWVDNIFEAKASDFEAAEHRVHWGPPTPSHLELPILPRPDGLPLHFSAPR